MQIPANSAKCHNALTAAHVPITTIDSACVRRVLPDPILPGCTGVLHPRFQISISAVSEIFLSKLLGVS